MVAARNQWSDRLDDVNETVSPRRSSLCLLEEGLGLGSRGSPPCQHVSTLEAHSHTALMHGGVRTDGAHSPLEYECCDPSKYMRCAPFPCKQGLLNAVKWLYGSGRGRVTNFPVQTIRLLFLPSCRQLPTLEATRSAGANQLALTVANFIMPGPGPIMPRCQISLVREQ